MAAPKVFISSTCFDLKDIRSVLKEFVSSFGFEPVMSEFGDVFYHPDLHTHEACINEVSNCHMMILLIGGRFGGEYINDKSRSITNAEYEAAKIKNIPVFSYVMKSVLDNHHMYLKNRNKPFITEMDFSAIEKQEHALDIFRFIDSVRKSPTNKALEGFESFLDITTHLRKQWAGMFFEFLRNREIRTQMDVVGSSLSAIQTSGEKLEEIVKSLFRSVDKVSANSAIEDIDAKNAAIHFFRGILRFEFANASPIFGNLGAEADLETLAGINPVGKNWVQYVIALGCYRIATEAVGDNGTKIKLLKYNGRIGDSHMPGIKAYALGPDDGEQFDDGSTYDDFLGNKSLYETGIKKLSVIQRREVISHFLQSVSNSKWSLSPPTVG